ncbi:MAG: formate dehydrogenase subunit gamma [Pseudolabrys sp.]
MGLILFVVIFAFAQPALAQRQPLSVNPTANSVSEQQLLNELNKVEGRGSIPDVKSYVIEHPAGRAWQSFRTLRLKWIAGIAIVSVLALLTAFYLYRGSMRVEAGPSGRMILRFKVIERVVHWLVAISFVVLAITGLNITFGRSLLLPLVGLEAFSFVSAMGKYVHNYISFAFFIGIGLMFFTWVGKNLPTWADLEWMKMGGGMLGGGEPPSYKFNAGEKMIFWMAMLGGSLVSLSGFVLLFPFYGTGVGGMELTQITHSLVGVLMTAAIFVHIYMGTIGMEGALDGMKTGMVDANWAKAHHGLW